MTSLIPPSISSIPVLVEAASVVGMVRQRVARSIEAELRVTPIAPAIVIIVVAVAAFLALAVVIGAIAAYIWFCQSNGLGWPGLAVPGPKGGVYRLGCFK